MCIKHSVYFDDGGTKTAILVFVAVLSLLALANADLIRPTFGRQGRQGGSAQSAGVDFSGCQNDPETGYCCVEKDEVVTS
eukprot:maker-scaffold546_size140615-snap-gene-0.32 protein:Tk00846 transcript:maker-scaffold546_size140615-snap-gene-0.32-mRNA-1 annotation:"histidine kinase"